MADLHTRLHALIGEYVNSMIEDDYPAVPVAAALRAVVDLHALRPCTGMAELCAHLDPHNVCTTCGGAGRYVIGDPDSTARCSTIQAIADQLGLTEGTDRG